MRSQNFGATIKNIDGVKKLVIRSKVYYQNQLNQFKDDEEVTLYISDKRPTRSEQQNRYYFGVYLPLIARETGEQDIERLHELFKGKFLTKEIVEVLGEKVRIKGSTTKLSKGEFCEYIMAIENLTNVQAPPIDNWNIRLSTEE